MFDKQCKFVFVLFVIIFTNSCTSDDNILSEVPNVIHSENIYIENNKWIFSQMNRNYYWRKDMPDSLSCDYDLDPVLFYKSLLSKNDRFSYCETNTSYNGKSELKKYGFEYQNYRINDELFSQVLYVWDNNLIKQGLKRGNMIKFVDNNIIISGMINNDKFVSKDTLFLSNILVDNSNSIYLDSIYTYDDCKVGYLCYLKFDEIKDLEPVIKKFYENNITDLILDLRYNPGGLVSTCKYLTNSIVSENGYGNVFQYCTYNEILTRELVAETGLDRTISNYDVPNYRNDHLGNALYGLNLDRLFVLTSKYSASASEATIICLQPFMDVIIIGEQTYGKGVGSWTIRDNRYKYQIQPITMRYYNANMESTPDEGISVNYYMEDGYSTSKKDLGDIKEPLLMKALSIIKNDSTSNKSNIIYDLPIHDNIKQVGNPSFFNINY